MNIGDSRAVTRRLTIGGTIAAALAALSGCVPDPYAPYTRDRNPPGDPMKDPDHPLWSLKPTRVRIGQAELWIPRAYIGNLNGYVGPIPEFNIPGPLSITMLWPDFAPYSLQSELDRNAGKVQQFIPVYIYDGTGLESGDYGRASETIEQIVASENRIDPLTRERPEWGLREYDNGLPRDGLGTAAGIYRYEPLDATYKTPTGGPFRYVCRAERPIDGDPYPSLCTAGYLIPEAGVRIVYETGPPLLAEWRKLDQGIRARIISFKRKQP